MQMHTRNLRLSARVADLRASPVREILSVIDRQGMVSFAGGLPAAETFPVLSLEGMPPGMLQYGAVEGEPALRDRVARNLQALGLPVSSDQVLILSGSQQGIDLVAKLCVDPGTAVAVESPTYLAALEAFRFFGAQFHTFEPQRAGADWAARPPVLAYATPTFQNPTGRCYPAADRDALAAACDAHGVILYEDDPYRDLVYESCDRSPVCARLKRASYVYQGSFSKTLAPGLRLGFLAASADLMPHLVRLKQAADLHSSRISQWLVLEALNDEQRPARLAGVVASYRRKRDAFAQALERHLTGIATWDLPPGGLFFWLTLNRPVDTRELLHAAMERGVAFMPGEPFYPQLPECSGRLRLNFSHAGEAEADRGLRELAALLRER